MVWPSSKLEAATRGSLVNVRQVASVFLVSALNCAVTILLVVDY